ncbi:MAG TPA: C10 family peptidase [Candidatus Cloacimonadota bacterium]|nr:C10 family peptidase [Candidatus Cloacimonadota bacterium]HPT71898.1 C10 family peptidase [Candidatus Cloacimonadota bacterium]
MRLILSVVLLILISAIVAVPIPQEKAITAAQNWTNTWAPSDFTTRTIEKVTPITKDNTVTMYLVEYSRGFVLLSADDACNPIIGYGYNTLVNGLDHNPSFSEFIENHKMAVSDITNQRLDNSVTAAKWNAILNNQLSRDGTRSLHPLLSTTWDQGTPYNMYCPVDAAGPGGRVWAGCVATAMAQVMKYWNWPVTGVGSHSYHPSGYATQSANFGNTTYHWENMPNSVGMPNTDVGTLLWHLGISVNMMYAPDGSGAYSYQAAQALRQYFRYDSGLSLVSRDGYSDTEWDNLVRSQLDNALPMYYDGSGPGGGHAFVCDGYQNSNYFHFNWGWSGSYNGYFYLSNLNPGYSFNDGQDIITNMKPQNYNPAMAQISLTGMDCSVGDIVPISISNYPILPAWNINNISFVMQYDNEHIAFIGTDVTGSMAENATVTYEETTPGLINCTISSPTALFGGGTMLKLKFQPLEAGDFNFMVGDFLLNSTAVTSIQQTAIHANATVDIPQNSVIDLLNSMHIGLNEIATIPVSTTFILPSWNINHIRFLLHYQSDKVTFDSYDLTNCMLSGMNITTQNIADGTMSFDVTNSDPIWGNGYLLDLKFRATGNTSAASVATISVSDFYYGDALVTNLEPGYIVLSPITANDDHIAVIQTNQFTVSPNPFISNAKLSVQLTKQNQKVEMNIYNIRGQLVKSFPATEMKGNSLDVNWDGKDMDNHNAPAGVYLINIKAGTYNKTSRLLKF